MNALKTTTRLASTITLSMAIVFSIGCGGSSTSGMTESEVTALIGNIPTTQGSSYNGVAIDYDVWIEHMGEPDDTTWDGGPFETWFYKTSDGELKIRIHHEPYEESRLVLMGGREFVPAAE